MVVLSVWGPNPMATGQILPPLRNPPPENRVLKEVPAVLEGQAQPPQDRVHASETSRFLDRFELFGNRRSDNSKTTNETGGGLFGNSIWPRQPTDEEPELERRWQPFRADARPARLDSLRRPANSQGLQSTGDQQEEKKDWEPILKLGQMGNMRSARRFEMQTRPSPFDKRPQVYFDPGLDQQTNDRDGFLDRFSQRSQQTWSNTTSWFSERNQNLRQRANQSWQNLGRPQQDADDDSSNRESRRLFPRPSNERQQDHSDLTSGDRF